jgi:hypothetical protein
LKAGRGGGGCSGVDEKIDGVVLADEVQESTS